jgi:serine/threonine protein kinase/Flp pilus assembly protein TadD
MTAPEKMKDRPTPSAAAGPLGLTELLEDKPGGDRAALASCTAVSPSPADCDRTEELAPCAARPDSDHQAGSSPGGGQGSSERFRILRFHARGNLGEVYLGHDDELNRDVALKQIQGRYADDPNSRARFLLEAEVTGALEHPGIVPIHGLGRLPNGRPFYAMRFIRGESLSSAIKELHHPATAVRDPGARSLALRGILRRFVDVCNTMAYAHSRGVLHRDLKPGNIMLGPFGETLVVDWGLAKPLGSSEGPLPPWVPSPAGQPEHTQAGCTVGTPQFMSPEQAEGRVDELTPASDVYSLGAVLYMVLAGQAPITDTDMRAVLNRVGGGDFPPPRQVRADVPAGLEAVCLKAMALHPEDRYTSARALADDVERWLADEPVSTGREPWLDRAARWSRRHRPLLASLAMLLVAAVVALSIGNLVVRHEQKKTATQRNKAREAARQATSAALKAERAGRETRRLLANSHADAARLASQRGAWRDALVHYDQALAAGYEDSVGLRLAKVQAWMARNQKREAFHELEALARRSDLGTQHRAALLLWQAESGLRRDLTTQARQDLVRRALAEGLPPADAAFARALLADTAPEVANHLHRALELDPFHGRAIDQLGSLLFSLGERQQLRDLLGKAELLFPDDPGPKWQRAELLAVEGDLDAANQTIEEVVQKTRGSMMREGRALVEFLYKYRDMDAVWLDGRVPDTKPPRRRWTDLSPYAEALGTMAQFFAWARQDVDAESMHVAVFPPYLVRAMRPFPAAVAASYFGRHEPLLRAAEGLYRAHPEGVTALFYGTKLFQAKRLDEAERIYLRAATLPQFLNCRRLCRLGALFVENELMRLGDPPADLKERVRTNIRAFLDEPPSKDMFYATILVSLALRVDDPGLARTIALQWVVRAPEDPNARAWLAEVELRAHAFGNAIESAREALRQDPNHGRAKRLLATATARLRDQARTLAPDVPAVEPGP